MGESDADLVLASLRGEKDAFAALILRHQPTAVALAARVLGSADLGNDAVQEATIAAMSGLDQLRSADRFGAWFCALCITGSACSCAAAATVQAARTKAATAGERASWGQARASVASGRSLTGR